MNANKDTDLIFVPFGLMSFFVALFEALPFTFVIPHKCLVIESIDLDGHRLDVLREREHRCQRLIVEKLQTWYRVSRYLKRRRTRQRKTPQAKARHRRVIRPDIKTRRFERADNAPV